MATSLLRTAVAAALLLSAIASAYTPTAQPAAPKCSWSSGKGASFDLTKLQELSQNKPLTMADRMQAAEKDFKYTFGVCTTVAPPGICKMADGSPQVNKDAYWAPAWQTNTTQSVATYDNGCFYLGNADMNMFMKWGLLDETDPALGVKLTYTGGEHCSSGARRQFEMKFTCAKGTVEKIGNNVIDESAHCKYSVEIESEYACPTECGFGGGHAICNNHGVCGYDTDSKSSKCFCNEGYSGKGCDKATAAKSLAGYGPILGLLIFVTIALIGTIAGIVWLWRWLSKRTAPMDGDAYSRLENNFGGGLVEGGDSMVPMRMDVKGPDSL